jgi:hypothetical protein
MPHLFKLSVFTAGLAFQDSAKQAAGELVSHIYSAREIHNVLSIYVYGSSLWLKRLRVLERPQVL